MALWQFLLADGNLPTPTNEQLGLWIVCAGAAVYVLTQVKNAIWPDKEKEVIARAELVEKIALASKSVDDLDKKHDELRAWAHTTIHKLAESLNGLTIRLATLDVRQEQTGKMVEKVNVTSEGNDKKLTRLLALCEQWTVLKPPIPHAE